MKTKLSAALAAATMLAASVFGAAPDAEAQSTYCTTYYTTQYGMLTRVTTCQAKVTYVQSNTDRTRTDTIATTRYTSGSGSVFYYV